uniref:Knottin scorpion toxin-like domain-containing protein n=1 Tax=Oryza barthii TaxID=65489 RepID=A0A0D3GG51_9ORYZ
MARVGNCAAVIALLVLVALAASAVADQPRCCVDYHSWGGNTGCGADQKDACNTWCQSQCRGGECKPRGDRHFCHCFC